MNLQQELEQLKPQVVPSPWVGHEHVRGWGVFGLPLSSGHVLALRVFPVNDFSPYVTLWLRDPNGDWAIYYDAVRPDVACPRYYGAATRTVQPAHIDIQWQGPSELLVTMDEPRLEWRVWASEPAYLSALNTISGGLPFWTWKHASLLKPREWMARLLGVGNIQLAGRMPSGHFGTLMPQRMYFIDRSTVTLDGQDLGTPVRVHPNPDLGGVPLPARGILAIGQAHWDIQSFDEYRRTRTELGVPSGA